MSTNSRLVELDALRGIAAMMVVAFHFTARYQAIYGHSAALWFDVSWGHLGVDLFFIISGFVIFMTLKRTTDARDFLVSRFSRLYPGYWVALISTYVIVSLFSLPGREVSIFDAVVNFSMIQYWLKIPNVDSVYWTLTLELSFYAIMLSFFQLRWLNRIERLAIVGLLFYVMTYLFEQVSGLQVPGLIQTTLLIGYGQLFIAGIMFFRLHEMSVMYPQQRTSSIHLILMLCLGVHWLMHGADELLATSLFFSMFYAIIYGNRLVRFVLTRPLIVFFGVISYSLYLIHQNIGYVVLRQMYGLNYSPFTAIPAAVVVSLVLATFITFAIEKPAMRAIRTMWRRRLALSRSYSTTVANPRE
jgi:peptidoglycan/LPS O-acetylase OafA/YrhL